MEEPRLWMNVLFTKITQLLQKKGNNVIILFKSIWDMCVLLQFELSEGFEKLAQFLPESIFGWVFELLLEICVLPPLGTNKTTQHLIKVKLVTSLQSP